MAEQREPETDPGISKELIKQGIDGSEEAQVQLGKHYLTLADSEVSRKENGELAVLWFLKASKQGNIEATECLRQCLGTKTGITDENLDDVKWCLESSTTEKQVHFAAKKLFHSLNKARKDVLSKQDYLNAVQELTNDSKAKSLLSNAGKMIGDAITEDKFVKTLTEKIQGKINEESEEESEVDEDFNRQSFFTKVMKNPVKTAQILLNHILLMASERGIRWLMSFIPRNQLWIMFSLFIYSMISLEIFFFAIPLVVFYFSLATMIISTLQMFYGRQKLSDVTVLTRVLKEYEIGVDIDKAQSQYSWNSLTPYIVYFISMFLTIVSFSISNKSYIPCSELCFVSFVFAISCFIALSDEYDHLLILAVLTNILASLPLLLKELPAIPVLSKVLQIIASPIITINLGIGLKLHFGFPSLCYALLPVVFIIMAMQKSWQGFYRVLVPHLICYFWWNLMSLSLSFSTWFGLFRASIGYILLPVILPLSLVIFVVILFIMFLRLIQTDIFSKLFITLLLLLIPFVLNRTKTLFGLDFDVRYAKIKKFLIVIFAVVAVLPLLFLSLSDVDVQRKYELSWNTYSKVCGCPDTKTQMACAHMKGLMVSWSGNINHTKVSKIKNAIDTFVSHFPYFLAELISCAYGEYYECDANVTDVVFRKGCKVLKLLNRKCHIHNYDTYGYFLTINSIDQTKSLILKATHQFTPQIEVLKVGELINFTAMFDDNLNGEVPVLLLHHMTSQSQELPKITRLSDITEIVLSTFQQGLSVIIRFFWFPVLEYIPEENN